MSMRRQKIALLFKGDLIISLTPLDPETEQELDKTIGDMRVKKMQGWCG